MEVHTTTVCRQGSRKHAQSISICNSCCVGPLHLLGLWVEDSCKQSQTVGKGWSSSLVAECGAHNSTTQQITMLQNLSQHLSLGHVPWNGPSNRQ
jgi:hypothetical protein